MFSQRHFEAIALICQDLNRAQQDPDLAPYIAARAQDALSALFRRYNARFDAERFRRACVPGANVRGVTGTYDRPSEAFQAEEE